MVTPENVSGGEGLSLQCICSASLHLWFCLFCLHSRSRSSWTSFLELLSPRQSQVTNSSGCSVSWGSNPFNFGEFFHRQPQSTWYRFVHHSPPSAHAQTPFSHLPPTKKKKKPRPMREICSTRPQELFQAFYLWQLHNTIMMWIRKILPLSHFPSSRYSFLLESCVAWH